MKVCTTSLIVLAGLVLSAASSRAQVIVSVGSSAARDCYFAAKSGSDPSAGISACNRALAEDALIGRDRAGTYVNRGVMEAALKQPDKALADYSAAIAIDPSLGDAYVNMGSAMIGQQRYQEALEQINKGLDLGMSFPQIGYYDRAIAEEMMSRYKEAYYDYKKVLEIDPTFTRASDELKFFTVTRKPADTDKPS